jgi:tRNA wybutosine-synthesizing protein 2
LDEDHHCTMVRAVRVPKARAEEVRHLLNRKGLVIKELRIEESEGGVLIPVHDAVTDKMAVEMGLDIVPMRGRARSCFRDHLREIKAIVEIPEHLRSSLPRKWELLGDVLIIRLPEMLVPYKGEVAQAYATELGAKAVLRERGHISGQVRHPEMELLLGTDTETVHREGSVLYKLDPMKVMFSSGNVDEKQRMARLDCRGETVVDMFAGIGYFTMPLAVRAKAAHMIACEINPEAFHYLRENIHLNQVGDVVIPVLGDNRDLPGVAIADRVVMGYIGTEPFLPTALRLIRPGGVIHYHDVARVDEIPGKMLRAIERACAGRRHEVLLVREAKTYGPCKSHMVVDFRVME